MTKNGEGPELSRRTLFKAGIGATLPTPSIDPTAQSMTEAVKGKTGVKLTDAVKYAAELTRTFIKYDQSTSSSIIGNLREQGLDEYKLAMDKLGDASLKLDPHKRLHTLTKLLRIIPDSPILLSEQNDDEVGDIIKELAKYLTEVTGKNLDNLSQYKDTIKDVFLDMLSNDKLRGFSDPHLYFWEDAASLLNKLGVNIDDLKKSQAHTEYFKILDNRGEQLKKINELVEYIQNRTSKIEKVIKGYSVIESEELMAMFKRYEPATFRNNNEIDKGEYRLFVFTLKGGTENNDKETRVDFTKKINNFCNENNMETPLIRDLSDVNGVKGFAVITRDSKLISACEVNKIGLE